MNQPHADMQAKLVILGEVLFDCFPDGEAVLGGAPFNVAWHLQAFGIAPFFVSAVGNDALGERILNTVTHWGMDTRGISRVAQATGQVQIQIENGEPHYSIDEHSAYDEITLPDTLPEGDLILYHGSLALRHPHNQAQLQSLIDGRSLKRFIDINLRDPWWQAEHCLDLIRYADCVKINLDEMHVLAAAAEIYHDDWLQRAQHFKQYFSIVNLLVTRGDQGATLINAEGDTLHTGEPPHSPAFVDSVGAGDAFASVTLLGYLHNWDWHTTLERAQQFASFIVTQQGALCHDPNTYQDFKNLWGIL